MSLGIRLKRIFDYAKTNPNKFAASIGKRGDNYNNIINGKTQELKSDHIAEILEAFPFVNARWFLTGKGEMFNENIRDYDFDQSRIDSVCDDDGLKYEKENHDIEQIKETFNSLMDEFIQLRKENKELKKKNKPK